MTTRFAPSPTGHLHLGHAYAAWIAWETASQHGGNCLLRWEDIDPGRCRASFENDILEDLAWLGFIPAAIPWRQSSRMNAYFDALARLDFKGLIYPCFCTRKEIQNEIRRAGHAPHGPDGPLYPGTCSDINRRDAARRVAAGEPHALRLRMDHARATTGSLEWTDLSAGTQTAQPELLGDVVLARKEIATSYHLAVVVDDAAQHVTLVTRGDDLFQATHLHRLLQELLELPVPEWLHHRVLVDEYGRRLAKRDGVDSLCSMRQHGVSTRDVLQMIRAENETDPAGPPMPLHP